jgi:hypothetical protein
VVVIERESRHNRNMLLRAVVRRPYMSGKLPSRGWSRREYGQGREWKRFAYLANAGYGSSDYTSKKEPKRDQEGENETKHGLHQCDKQSHRHT